MSTLSLFLGLGNPGAPYAHTRHNFGFFLADALVEHCDRKGVLAPVSGVKNKFQAWKCVLPDSADSWIVAKPLTFMNNSGEAAVHLLHYYRIPIERLFVAHDELDLPFGRMRLKFAGGAAGHNGIRSICELTGSADFYRLRLGIGKPGEGNVLSHVLRPFSEYEQTRICLVVEAALRTFLLFAEQGFQVARHMANAFSLADDTIREDTTAL